MNFIVKSVVAGHRPVYLWDDKNVALLSCLSFRGNEKGITYVLHVSVLRAMYCFSYLASKKVRILSPHPRNGCPLVCDMCICMLISLEEWINV